MLSQKYSKKEQIYGPNLQWSVDGEILPTKARDITIRQIKNRFSSTFKISFSRLSITPLDVTGTFLSWK